MRDPLWQAAKAAQQRGGMVSVDPRELCLLIEERDAAADLVEEAVFLLAYSGNPKAQEWRERAETAMQIFDEMEDSLKRRAA